MGSDYISSGLCLSFYFQCIVKFSIFVRRGLLIACRVLPITFKSLALKKLNAGTRVCRTSFDIQ